VARAEVERKAARQRLANAQRAQAGIPTTNGIKAFGYTRDAMSIVPAEAALVRDGAKRVLAGESLASVARGWTRSGCLSPWGRKAGGWSSPGVRSLLTSPRYAGLRVYNGEVVGKGQWPAILDDETHLALRALLLDPQRVSRPGRGGCTPTSLLTGIAHCAVCGCHVMLAANRRVSVYRCAGAACASVDRHELDDVVTAHILTRLAQPDVLPHLGVADGRDEVERVRGRSDGLRKRRQVLVSAYATGTIGEEDFNEGLARLSETIEETDMVLASASGALHGLVGPDPIALWSAASLERQRAAIQALLQVTVRPRTPGKRTANVTVEHCVAP
jgi:hypothetical protein